VAEAICGVVGWVIDPASSNRWVDPAYVLRSDYQWQCLFVIEFIETVVFPIVPHVPSHLILVIWVD
jgi:hypothetical protein